MNMSELGRGRGPIVLTSPKDTVQLRQLMPEESGELFALFDTNRCHLRNFMPGLEEFVRSEEALKNRITRAMTMGDVFTFGIREGEALVGQQTLVIEDDGIGELETWVGKQFSGFNLAARSMFLLIDFAFETLNLPELRGYTFIDNDAGIVFIEKMGFKYIDYVSDQLLYALPNPNPAS